MDNFTVVLPTLLSYLEPVRVAFARAGLVMDDRPTGGQIVTRRMDREDIRQHDASLDWVMCQPTPTEPGVDTVLSTGAVVRRRNTGGTNYADVSLTRDISPLVQACIGLSREFGADTWRLGWGNLEEADTPRNPRYQATALALQKPLRELCQSLPSVQRAVNGSPIFIVDPSADLQKIATFFLSLKEDRPTSSTTP